MNRIIFICPYFGRFPVYFDLVLESISYNSTIDWLIFTDDRSKHEYPPNVKVIYCSFSEMRNIISKELCTPIYLNNSYKLCDFRPFYGIIFKKYIISYNFWGHCDFDCIFGRIRKYLTEDILNTYDKVLFLGHMSLYKNSENINSIIKSQLQENTIVKQILMNKNFMALDERIIIKILEDYNVNIYKDDHEIADIYCLTRPFQIVRSILQSHKELLKIDLKYTVNKERFVFEFSKGVLKGKFLCNKKIYEREYMYIHLQKRKMGNLVGRRPKFLIVPNQFIEWKSLSEENILKYIKNPIFYKKYFIIRMRNLKEKLKRWSRQPIYTQKK